MDTTAAYAVKDRDLRGFKALLEKITSQVTGLVNHRPQGTEKDQWREEYLKSSTMQEPAAPIIKWMAQCLQQLAFELR
jgi:hypothetical protein